MKKYNWAIIGTGVIGNEMARALKQENGEIYGVYNHHVEKGRAFAHEYGVQKVFESEEALLADPEVDVVYIGTPHNYHYATLMRAVEAGKHVFCEKAITVNARQLETVAALASEKGVVVMEGMTIYHMPLYQRLREIVDSGAIGKVKMIQVNFGSCKEYDVKNRFFDKALAGGALLDIGIYAMSFARFFMEARPNVILTTPQYFETGVDEQSGIILKNDRGQMAVTALTMRAKQPKRGVVAGELGYIEVDNYPRAQRAVITYTSDGRQETVEAGKTGDALCYEVRHMQEAIESRAGIAPLALSRDVMEILTAVRGQWGMQYPFE
ncbi:Gfo/Idh/MocA family protein [Eubacterium maltosivorans]|uniref:Gfo/Idh/MocA family oxidoreductase n=1 Tax=Eubacterium maltosivorans TaxID=2041044 RepID=A0A4P9C6W1_EUBML|nr:Gfo/Idh/MocA family oxidoreductase [Eubacterium maltosivorans]QCT70325.1 gfo/Idh/MocA family oxidoreductase [Eubacterium maltosivorans]